MEKMKKERLQDGDLIFVTGQSDMAQAVQASTGFYSHVALYLADHIYHASSEKGVEKLPLEEFLQDQEYHVYTPRELDLPGMTAKAESLLGLPYNASFYPDGEGYYCSQLIAEILPIFDTVPMQFGDDKNAVSPFWQDYYQQLGSPVPVGQAGTNPSLLAQSQHLRYKGKIND